MPTTKVQREANRQVREQGRIAGTGLKKSFKITRSLMATARRLWLDGIDPTAEIAAQASRYEPAIFDALVTAHANARFQAIVRAAKAGVAAKALAIPGLHGEALKFVEQRAAMSAEQVAAINSSYGGIAGTATGQIGTLLEEKVGAAVARAVEQGLPVRDGAKLIGQAFATAGVVPANAYTLDTIYRTNVSTAYAAGRWQANQDPAIDEILWGYEYSTAGDDRVRLEHDALEGISLPKDDPRWAEIAPPNGWNCRCTLIEIYDTDEQNVVTPPTDPVEIEGEVVVPGPAPEWKFHPLAAVGEAPVLGTLPATP